VNPFGLEMRQWVGQQVQRSLFTLPGKMGLRAR